MSMSRSMTHLIKACKGLLLWCNPDLVHMHAAVRFCNKHYFSMNSCSCLWDLVTLSNGWIWWLSSTAYLTQIFVTCLWSLFLKWSRYKNVAVTFSFRLHLISDKPPRWSFWHFRGIRAKLCDLSKWRSQAGKEARSRVKTNLYDALENRVLPTTTTKK